MRETAENGAGPAAEKRAVSKFRNEKHAIFTTNHQCIALTMRLHTRILVEVFFRIPVLLILVGASPFALSLTVKSIISSSVSQAIRSIFSGHVLRPTLVLYFRCRHRPRVFRKFWATNALLLDVIKCLTPGICTTGTGRIDPTQEPLVQISETAAS